MAEFDSITLTEIGYRFKHNLQGTIDWCREHGLVHTNGVEGMWQKSKSKFKSMYGPTNRDMIPDYLAEFMWSQRFGKTNHPFFNFWMQIADEMYIV